MKTKIPLNIILVIIITIVFIPAFIINITSNQSLYNSNLNIVPKWQTDTAMSDTNFINFMNIISNIFNPILCAAYIGLFWLISSRKLEILVFLVWFIFLSFLLSILKMAFAQERPYWIEMSGMKMLQWTCYTQYGMPSGHSMLGLILMQFIIRFFARTSTKTTTKVQIFQYIIALILQLLVMLSRVILGMHSFNQVFLGALMGMYSISLYYICIERQILKYFKILIESSSSQSKNRHIMIIFITMFFCQTLQGLVALIPKYPLRDHYFTYIISISGCQGAKQYKSFHFKCLEDSALIMAGIGILLALLLIKNPQNLVKELDYSRASKKFLKKLLLMIICALIPAAIFLNPLWTNIGSKPEDTALTIWVCQNVCFFLVLMILLAIFPRLCGRFDLQTYKNTNLYSYQDKTKKNSLQLEGEDENDIDIG